MYNVLDNHDSRLALQEATGESYKGRANGHVAKGYRPTAQPSLYDDKEALLRLLRPGLAEVDHRHMTEAAIPASGQAPRWRSLSVV